MNTIWHKIDGRIFKLGLGKGFKGQGDNHWIITAYEVTREKDKTFGDALFADKHPLSNPNNKTIPNQTLKNAESSNIQSFLGINYGNINKQASDKLTSIEKQTSENLAGVSGMGI